MANIDTSLAPIAQIGAKIFGMDADGVSRVFSGQGAVISLSPSGDETFVDDSAALQGAIDGLAALGGGTVLLNSGDWYAKNITLKSGVSICGVALPKLVPVAVCPDLGLDNSDPFPAGVVFRGSAGDEIVFTTNLTDLPAPTNSSYNANDISTTGVRLSCLCADGVASLLTCGGANHCGLSFSVLEYLYGNDIQGTFLDLVNIQHVHGRMLKAFGSNHLLRVGAYHAACQPGNSYFNDLYLYSWAEPSGTHVGKNTSWGIKLDTRSAGAAVGGGPLNYVTLGDRVQVNGFHDTALGRSRGNACIVCEGASLQLPVNSCSFRGLDLEGKWSYGIKMQYCTNCRVDIDGVSTVNDFVSAVRIKNSRQLLVNSITMETSMWIDIESSVFFSGFLKYYARDENDASPESHFAKGVYNVYAKYSSGAPSSPVYDPIKTNGVTYIQLGYQNSYNVQLSGSENVIRRTLTPMAENLSARTSDKTWSRWEACICKLSANVTTQTLPVIDSTVDGVVFTFKAMDANAHTIQGQSSQQINNASTYALAGNGVVRLVADDATKKWLVI